MSFADRYGPWALVTGGTAGIGGAIARQLAAEGLDLVLVARNPGRLTETAKALEREHGIRVETVPADLTDPEAVGRIIAATEHLEVGLLVPGAAIENHGRFTDTPVEREAALVQMDVTAPMLLAHHYGARMAARGRGGILFVASLSGHGPQPLLANYGAAKAYIRSLGEALHHELKDKGVDVSVLSPGPTDTAMAAGTGLDFSAMGMKVMRPDAVAAVGLAALGRRAAVIPGGRNRLMAATIALMPRQRTAAMLKRMVEKQLPTE